MLIIPIPKVSDPTLLSEEASAKTPSGMLNSRIE